MTAPAKIVIDDASVEPQVQNAVSILRHLNTCVSFWGCEADLRHPLTASGQWFADGLSVARQGEAVGVAWKGEPMGACALRPGDRLVVHSVREVASPEIVTAPADQDRLELTLKVVRKGGAEEVLPTPLEARNALGGEWSYGDHAAGELFWLRARIDDLTTRPLPKKGIVLADLALALDAARTALDAADSAVAEAARHHGYVWQWIANGGDLDPSAMVKVLRAAEGAARATARAGYAVARAEAVGGAWRSTSLKQGAAAKARHVEKAEAKEKIRQIWSMGQCETRDLCAELNYEGLGISYSTARKALIGTPDPGSKP